MFQSNIINVYGEKGKAWLAEMPQHLSFAKSRVRATSLPGVYNKAIRKYCRSRRFAGDEAIHSQRKLLIKFEF